MATAALVLCLLSPFAGAVTISYSADSGGESVSINENYDVDNTVTVKETTDISFGNLQVDQERTAEGTGKADLKQTITGKAADGTQYTAGNVILTNGTIDAKTYTSATGSTLGVAQTVSATGDAKLQLEGEEGGNRAGQYASVENGMVSSRQALVIGNSVHTSQDTSIRGKNPMAFGGAGDLKADLITGTIDGEGAVIGAGVLGDGDMDASFSADTSHSASASGSISAEGDLVVAGAGAGNIAVDLATGTIDGEGAVIGAGAFGDGEMDATLSADTSHSASASGSISAEGLEISAIVGAVNQYGAASIENTVDFGTLDFESLAIANEDEAFCSQDLSAEGSYIYKFVEADNFAGPYASDTTEVWDGTLAASSTATVNETSAQVTDSLSAEGLVINKSTYAESWVGYTEIDIDIENGTLNGEFLGKASDVEAFCSQDMNFTGDLDEWIEVYNVVMSAGGWAHIWSTVPIEDPVDLWSNATVNETNTMINIGVGISP